MNKANQNVVFDDQIHANLQRAFLKAWKGFPQLHQYRIIVKTKKLKKVCMRAQPLLNASFFNPAKRNYRIEVHQAKQFQEGVPMYKLPQSVLIGWFAHELGHLMDYKNRSTWSMIKLGIGYLFFPAYKIGVERRADIYAIHQGFANFIQRTKRFILRESDIPNAYLKRINRFYMSPDEIDALLIERDGGQTQLDSLI